MARDALAAVLLLVGSGLTLVAAIGLGRMEDLYARMHVATKPATLGMACCLAGAALRLATVPAVVVLVLALGFQLVTAPVASHLLARAAHRAGAPLSSRTVADELFSGPPRSDLRHDLFGEPVEGLDDPGAGQ